MITILKNGEIYAPQYLGKKDILIAGSKISTVADEIPIPEGIGEVNVIDASNKIITPGFIDAHVHITGGGGEGGYKSRTPELNLTDATIGGVTTLVGVLGTDGTTRTMGNLIAKAKGLREEGISCYVHTGSYQVPVKTLTGSIEGDLLYVEEIIGAGEIAISDHRSSQPTVEEFARIASEARNGGILSGKAGIVNVHVGDSKDKVDLLEEVAESTEIPIKQFYPTHMNRTPELFEAGIRYAKKGGYVDFTTSTIPKFLEEGELKCGNALKKMLEAHVSVEQITFTSDGQASLPDFDQNGDYIGMKIGKVSSLYNAVKEAVTEYQINLEEALKVITSNPASILKLHKKGRIDTGLDADLVMLNQDLEVVDVFALGKEMVRNGEPVVTGTFE
ncbi:beta-aspartyl-peptidase [Pontibacillus yanchengensis]|uniref:Beta-aspartyl-peptidase n=1 Tax=Pontibacillus yanchengensis TaxID=462910 RepID=A0ACC7VID2_9BACI|nr:beta-aspartyl-peptidase [Pontibacillus yanchengensis]MYL54728.1 beta-aspartyl-peptidase [Pontibacillus yanchengensis]